MQSAAIVRSPSFSRSSSSTTTSMRPARNSSSASGMVAKDIYVHRIPADSCVFVPIRGSEPEPLIQIRGNRRQPARIPQQIPNPHLVIMHVEQLECGQRKPVRDRRMLCIHTRPILVEVLKPR